MTRPSPRSGATGVMVEVSPGDILPGVGRVEGVERHGREWVVVTRQGLVTSQPW